MSKFVPATARNELHASRGALAVAGFPTSRVHSDSVHEKLRNGSMESWNKHMLYEFSLYKFVIEPVGCWPITERSLLDKLCIVGISVLQACMVVNILIDFSESPLDNIDVAVDRFSLCSCGTLSLVKVWLIRGQRDRLSKFMEEAAVDWSTAAVGRHRDTMLRYAEIGRLFFFFQTTSAILTVTMMTVVPLTLPNVVYSGNETLPLNQSLSNETLLYMKLLPHGSSCIFPTGKPTLCNARYALQSAQLFSTSMANLGSDVFLCGLGFHLCGQFERLIDDVSELGKDESVDKERRKVVRHIRRHCLLLHLADGLESFIKIILIPQLLLSSIQGCFIGFEIIFNIKMHNYALLFRNSLGLVIMLTQLFFYCYMGDLLSSGAAELTEGVYMSDWYNLPPSRIKDLCFVTMRASVPFHITAGSVYNMDLNNFKNILKTWFSYVSILQLVFKRLIVSRGLIDCESLSEQLRGMSNQHWKKDFTYAMRAFKYISWPLGIWPLQNYNCFALTRSILAFSVQASMMIIVNLEMYLSEVDIAKNIDALMLTGCGILGMSKLISCRLFSTELVYNYTSALKDYQSIDSEDTRRIMRRHAYLARLTCAALAFCSSFSSVVFMATPMLLQDANEMVNITKDEDAIEYPIPSAAVFSRFEIPKTVTMLIFALEGCMLFITCDSNLGIDSLFFNITVHLCGQFELLKIGFSKVNNENEEPVECIQTLIKRHLHMIKLAEMLADSVNVILMIQLGVSSAAICVIGFQFILAITYQDVVMAIKTMMVLAGFLSQLYAYSYVGDYLACQMMDIGFSVYSSNWYDFPMSVTKDMIFIMMRAWQPVYLKAGKVFLVNMQMYITILKTSISYLSVLREMINT